MKNLRASGIINYRPSIKRRLCIMNDLIIIAAAGFLGGMLNAVAGGGSFITLPALILVGVSPVSANATGAAALLPGYIASAWRFRRDIEFPAGLRLTTLVLMVFLGGCLGASILLLTSEQFFSALIPWLILLATAMFAAGPWLLNGRRLSLQQGIIDGAELQRRITLSYSALFIVCIYGGYFNGGLGIILLAALGLMGQVNVHSMNGIKNLISALLTAIAVAIYAVGGVINSENLIVLGVAAILGGYAGAAIAYRVSQRTLRIFIVAVGLLMSLMFFLA